ncbi:MAG: methylaspartate mutase accessory protein GlmL [Patescibacteria group bacterium]
MRPFLLIDFGSTYTKVAAVDADAAALLGTAQAPTTVRTGLSHGLGEALEKLWQKTGPLDFARRLACSSAAGGLRMAAVGLVPELTVEAARRAALGAGARLLAAYGYKLSRVEIARLEELSPDLILLAGGTDGGNEEVVLANAALLAGARFEAPLIVACNKSVAERVAEMLRRGGKTAVVTANVLPELGRVETEPARAEIRRLFLERIVRAKGLDEVAAMIDGILMPTPAAALRAAELLAQGPGGEPGWGELVLVDLGGATTDMHSLAAGTPSRPEMLWKGLPEPFAKRTVEGDLGMRYSATALIEACGLERAAAAAGLEPGRVRAGVEARAGDAAFLPASDEERRIEEALAILAVSTAVKRHAGVLETLHTPFGASHILRGKDLTPVGRVIGSGGVFLASSDPARLLAGAAFDPGEPDVLKPMHPEYYLDRDYIMPAMGLLAAEAPGAAYRLMNEHVVKVG